MTADSAENTHQSPSNTRGHPDDPLRDAIARLASLRSAVNDAREAVNTRIPAGVWTIRGSANNFQDKFANDVDAAKEHTREIRFKVETTTMKLDNLETSLRSALAFAVAVIIVGVAAAVAILLVAAHGIWADIDKL